MSKSLHGPIFRPENACTRKHVNCDFFTIKQHECIKISIECGIFWLRSYRVLFLTVPLNFQYQKEKHWAANQRFSSMIFLMYKRSSLVEQHFLFSTEIWAEQLKKAPCKSHVCEAYPGVSRQYL